MTFFLAFFRLYLEDISISIGKNELDAIMAKSKNIILISNLIIEG
ncbi:MAG: hypothetical protein ACP5U0_00570 [Caldisphaera sp.]